MFAILISNFKSSLIGPSGLDPASPGLSAGSTAPFSINLCERVDHQIENRSARRFNRY